MALCRLTKLQSDIRVGQFQVGIDPPDNIQHHERLIVDLIRPATTWIEAATDG